MQESRKLTIIFIFQASAIILFCIMSNMICSVFISAYKTNMLLIYLYGDVCCNSTQELRLQSQSPTAVH